MTVLTRTELVGREAELAVLCDCLDAALEGDPRLVLCQGEPGIGKTRLAEELLGLARDRGVRTVWGGGVDSAGAPPYWPWRQVFRGVADLVDLTAIADQHGLSVDLARLAPDLFPGSGEPGVDVGSMEDRFRQFDAVAVLLRQVTRRAPLVLVLDDAQWADQPSMLLLRHVAQGLRNERLLVVVSCRDTEPAAGALVAELLREPGTRQIRLGCLAAPAVGQQLASLVSRTLEQAEVEQVLTLTGGNPFFVEEMGRMLADRRNGAARLPVTVSVREAVDARLRRLPPECVRLLQVASIVGQEFSVDVVATMVDVPVLSCLSTLDDAAAAGLVEVTSTPSKHRFRHALVRDAIEAGMGTPQRVHLHLAAAEALEQLYGDRVVEAHVFDLARHWAVAAVEGDRARALRWIERAAREAMRTNAYEEAVRLFRLALDTGADELEEAGRCRLLLGLGGALHLLSDVTGGLEACREAALIAGDIGRPDLMAEAALVTEPTFWPETDLVVRQLCEKALVALGPDRTALRVGVLARLAEVCMYLGDDETARTASEESLTLAEQCGEQDPLVAALEARQDVCSGPDSLEERAVLAERMLAVGRQPPNPKVALAGHLCRIDAALERGNLSVVAQEIEAAAWCAQEVRGRLARWLLLRSQCVLAQAQARFDDARRLAVEAFSTIAPLGHPSAPIVWAGFLSTTAHHVGHDTESLSSNGLADAPVDQRNFPTAGVIRALAPALVLAEVGRLREAAAIYRSLGPVADWRPTPHATLFTFAFGVNLAIALEAFDDVATLRQRLNPYRGHHVVSGVCSVAYFGPVELWLGVAAAHLGLLDDAVADFERAAKACAVSGAAGFHAEAQYELASALARRAGPGDLARARSLVAESARQAAALGMPPIIAKANRLIARLDDAGQALPLTRREREVAELVAQGLTNREIAAQLYLSERTAQNHVQHILDKLDVANRSQIAVMITSKK